MMTRLHGGTGVQAAGRKRRIALERLLAAGLLTTFAACASDKILATRPLDPASSRDVTPALTVSDHFAFWNVERPTSVPFVSNGLAPSPVPISVSTPSTGTYFSFVPGMSHFVHPGSKEIVMTTSDLSPRTQCVATATSAFQGDTLEVRTDCDDLSTLTRTFTEFSTLVVGPNSVSGTHAYAENDFPSRSPVTPDPQVSFTTGAGPILFTRTAVGDWKVTLGTGSPEGSIYLVNSTVEGTVCNMGDWTKTGARVRCFNNAGGSADVAYRVLQISGGRLTSGGAVAQFGFAWADKPSAKNSYTPNASFSRGSAGPITVTRTSIGEYQVVFANLQNPSAVPEDVQLTPFGLSFAVCSDRGRTDAPTGRLIEVQCRDAQGALVDTRFNILLDR